MELKKITSSIKIIFLATIIAGGMNYLMAWTGPTATPPGGNVPAPLNVAYDNPQQAKLGGLQLNTGFPNADIVGLSVFGKSIFNGAIQITTGAGTNKVLTSDGLGNATWVTPSSAGSGGGVPNHIVTFGFTGSAANWRVPAGVTKVFAKCWGGGGAGSSVRGGGGAGYAEKVFTVNTGDTMQVSVGRGAGLLGDGGDSYVSVVGQSGGISCNGGDGNDTNLLTTGSGGTASGGDINLTGGHGYSKVLTSVTSLNNQNLNTYTAFGGNAAGGGGQGASGVGTDGIVGTVPGGGGGLNGSGADGMAILYY
jgi:hypothetical protein